MNFNEQTNTLLYKNISLTLYSRKGWCFCSAWEMGGEIYTQREDFFPYLLPGARGCQCLHPLASSSETPSDRLHVPHSTAILCLCLDLTAWFSSHGLLLVTHLFYPSALIVLPSLLITMWQLVKTHGVTRNEMGIDGICYITYWVHKTFFLIPCYWKIYIDI